jgi:hypothetical protein
MASAAGLALSNPDFFLARPEKQVELLDMLARYGTVQGKVMAHTLLSRPNPRGGKRVTRGRRKGRPTLAVQAVLKARRSEAMNPEAYRAALFRVGQRDFEVWTISPHTGSKADILSAGTSKREALRVLREHNRRIDELRERRNPGVSTALSRRRGNRTVHQNPDLLVLGANPPIKDVETIGRVEEIKYHRITDGKPYKHTFKKRPFLVLLSDGSFQVRHPGVKLWGDL